MKSYRIITACLLVFLISACVKPKGLGPSVSTEIISATPFHISPSATRISPSATLTATRIKTPSETPTPFPTSTRTSTNTIPPTPSSTPTYTLIPTYLVLRGEVNVEHVSCFYGPHKSYLYKYGLVGGSNLEIIGILPDTLYIQVRAIGGDNPCWMNLEWMDVKGDIRDLKPIDPLDIVLPQSPYYGALGSVTAVREGYDVAISWSPLYISPGKDSEQAPYLVEVWVCQGGKLKFIPIGAYTTDVIVIDEPGCTEKSFGRVYGVEKHGYTPYLEINWPDFDE